MVTVLLTGTTGLVGTATLQRLLDNAAITKVISIQRRPLSPDSPASKSPKFEQLLIENEPDWTNYPATVKERLASVDAVIWSLGSPYFKDLAFGSRVCTDYTVYGLKTILEARGHDRKPLPFVYVSGALTVKDQDQSLFVMGGIRKLRGRTESEMLRLGEELKDQTNVYIARPGPILGPNRSAFANGLTRLVLGRFSIDVEPLAAALIKLATEAPSSTNGAVEIPELKSLGAAALKEKL